MATLMGSGSNLPAGGTHLWYWFNYVHNQVYTFAAKPQSAGLAGGTKKAQILSVTYVIVPQHDAPSKTHIEVVVHNPGSSSVNYDLFIHFV